MFRSVWAIAKTFILFGLIAVCCYLMTAPLENKLIDIYWRYDHMENEQTLQALQDIDEARYEQAQRFSNLLSQTENSSDIQSKFSLITAKHSAFLSDYVLLAYGTNFTVPPPVKGERWTPNMWAGLTDTLLKRDPLPKVTNRSWIPLLKILLSFVGTVFGIFIVGSMSIAIWGIFTFICALLLRRIAGLVPIIVLILTLVYALGLLFLVATLSKYSSLRVGLTDGIYKMVGFYQERTTYEERLFPIWKYAKAQNKPALMEFVTRLLLLSAQGAFMFALSDMYMMCRLCPTGFETSAELRSFNKFQNGRLAQDKKNQ